jgi:hypothetical protein
LSFNRKRYTGQVVLQQAEAKNGQPQNTDLCLRAICGLFAEAFAGHGLTVAGVDVNPEMLEAARRFVPGGISAQVRPRPCPFLIIPTILSSSALFSTNRTNY